MEFDQRTAKCRKARGWFEEAKSVFADEFALVLFDEDHSNDEERFLILGMSQKERILLVVHCYRENDTIRIISSRKATKNEAKQYKERKWKKNTTSQKR